MKDKKHKIKRNWSVVFYLSIAFIFVLIGQDLIRELVFFDSDLRRFEQTLQTDLQDSLKEDIEAKTEVIDYQLATLEDDFSNHVQENLEDLLYMMNDSNYLLDENNPSYEDSLVSLTSRYQDSDSEHFYYLLNTDGFVLYNGQTDSDTPEDFTTKTDIFGKDYIAEMITLASTQGEGFVTYYIQEDNQIHRYKGYIAKIEDQPYMIMTYGIELEYKEKVKQELISSFNLYGMDSSGEIYIYEQNGVVLYHNNDTYINLDMTNPSNPYLYKLKRLNDFIVTNEQSGFITYEFYQSGFDSDIIDKTAYVNYIEDLDIVIGSAINSDYYASRLAEFEADSLKRIMMLKIPVYVILLGIAALIYNFVRKNIYSSLRMLKEEERLYQRFADLTKDIILITNTQGTIVFTNKLGEKTLFPNGQKTQLSIDEILKEEESYYTMHTPNATYFVQYNVDEIYYHGELSKLYVCRDVTESIESLKEMQNVSLKDELTGLGNRRLMNKDYQDIIRPIIKNGDEAYLAIIDLDHFKHINDTHGHLFGDNVLRIISDMMQEITNNHIRVYRIGGDEFALFAWDMKSSDVLGLLTNLNAKIESYHYQKPVTISFSAGVKQMRLTKEDALSTIYHDADELLYQAKGEGRNKIIY